MDHELISTPNV